MTAALHTPQDSGVQRNSTLRVILTFEPFTRSRPREAPFSFASFLLGEQKKRSSSTQKKFISPLSTITQIKRLLTLNPFA
ncbi:MAG: hypothetical protein IJG80_10500 [Selenomonadaceae bacterium]|nr:hypothetical protein [Selenomonadaceae bacterium]MBQ3727491.1 hypothetical protein [Selenomonadaceae bacterium]